jgi:putative Mn2+ efflux pump MntP
MNKTQNEFFVFCGASKEQTPTSSHPVARLFGSTLGLHSFLGFVCLALLGLGFLLFEIRDWTPFLSAGAASCTVGFAASSLSAYHRGRGGVMPSLLFALPVLLVGVVARLGLSPSDGLPLDVWCLFGLLMFIASYIGGFAGGACGKKRHVRRTAKPMIQSAASNTPGTNEHEPPPAPGIRSQAIPNSRLSRKWKICLAFALGVAESFLACCVTMILMAVVGSELGAVVQLVCAAFIAVWICYFITQFLLSYGNPRALRKDWPVIAALNFAPFCSVIVFWVVVTWRAALAILVVAGITLVCSYAGAALATLVARRRLRVIRPELG